MNKFIDLVIGSALQFFGNITSLEEMESIYKETLQKESSVTRFGWENYPQRSLSYACTLTRLGIEKETTNWLNHYFDYYKVGDDLKSQIVKSLEDFKQKDS